MRDTLTERSVVAGLYALAVTLYAFMLAGKEFTLWRPGAGFELTFNSMLEHLLRGEFDVDPAIVGDEGFLRDGRVYAYWGIFCALLRLPLVLIPGAMTLDVVRLSCFLAVSLAAGVKLATLRLVFAEGLSSSTLRVLYWTGVVTILFTGPQITFLRQSIYQEVCFWAGAVAATFVYLAVRGVIRGKYSTRSLCAMAALAGVALLTRVSVGIPLYCALGLLLVVTLIRYRRDLGPAAARLWPTVAWPVLILAMFGGLTAFVNHQRWGNPLTFADYRLYIMGADYPDRLPRMLEFGLFNPARIPFGLIYYFLPVWVLRRPDGNLLFEEHQWRLFDSLELPPSSFFLTDPLFVLLGVYAGWSLLAARRSAGLDRLGVAALAAGFAVGPLLMLSAISMNFRYRTEFYPLLEFGAFMGFLLLYRRPPQETLAWKACLVATASAALGIVASAVVLLLYRVSAFGPQTHEIRRGVLVYYSEQLRSYFETLAAWLGR